MAQSNSNSQTELVKKLHRKRGEIKKAITELMKKINFIQENLATSDVDELQVTLETVTARYNNINSASGTNSASGSYRANNSFDPTNIPIPSIKFPKFDGTPEKCAAFLSVFKNTIDINQSLPKALKLYHLTSVLTDKAWSLIGHLEINDANYDHALSILVDKYMHTRQY
ncbi:uncharacterized protein LOC122860149 [Aphidius gifuensis]|uniref:uncharacterized protein LOC122860149 n=1 Tax=Aphidius gifuensis TaxID=684658 RepID=UPI001CDB5E0E|nr:uncharacterized protein LOC122860149 [Aphidius gifuensis]